MIIFPSYLKQVICLQKKKQTGFGIKFLDEGVIYRKNW